GGIEFPTGLNRGCFDGLDHTRFCPLLCPSIRGNLKLSRLSASITPPSRRSMTCAFPKFRINNSNFGRGNFFSSLSFLRFSSATVSRRRLWRLQFGASLKFQIWSLNFPFPPLRHPPAIVLIIPQHPRLKLIKLPNPRHPLPTLPAFRKHRPAPFVRNQIR